MDSSRPHAVMIPFPAQGHINPMFQLAKLLHAKGFYITFVNTDHSHQRLQRSRGSDCLDGVEGFRYEAIPDGLPASKNKDAAQNIMELCMSTRETCGKPFKELLMRLNSSVGVPQVSCVISDGVLSFTLEVARELGMVELVFWTPSACGFMGYLHYSVLIKRGYTPLKDQSCVSNGYLETPIDFIPGMKGIRLKDIPTFIQTTDRNDFMVNFMDAEAQNAFKASGVILNTFDEFEQDVVNEMKKMFAHNLYTIGSLSALTSQLHESPLNSISFNLWKEDTSCLKWLDDQQEASVVYVNFGSITVMTPEQLEEFAWGLANSKRKFLWVIRPDLVAGETTALSGVFEEIRGRGMLVSWCPQEKVLSHPAIGCFLTHSGWNSTLESIYGGVPMICWPFFSEQATNCRYACEKWMVGMEIDGNVKRDEVERQVKEMMEGERGKEMRSAARNWKAKAEAAVAEGGSSYENLERLVRELKMGKLPVVKSS